MGDLFGFRGAGEQLAMRDADVRFWQFVDLTPCGSVLFDRLAKDTRWEQKEVFVWGAKRAQPRLTAWYGDPGKAYTYSGAKFQPNPWTELLNELREQLFKLTNSTFNSVLLNLYRDNNDSMGLHSDDEPELGAEPVIASLSLGAERLFTFKHKTNGDVFKLTLPDCSLLLMAGRTQQNWKHGISKQSRKIGPRINLTFRTVI